MTSFMEFIKCVQNMYKHKLTLTFLEQLRLTGPEPGKGRLEILYEDEMGTVCDDGFTEMDAQAACRTMGYSNVETNAGIMVEPNRENVNNSLKVKYPPIYTFHKLVLVVV